MSLVDPIADYLTRVRNAIHAKKKYVEMPSSNMKVGISKLLKENNFVKDYNVIEDDKQNILRVHLQYVDGESSISGLKRISKQGLRQFVDKDNLPRVLNGLGIAVISTSKGLLTNQQAKKEQIGGEVICHIW
ncbi:MAG: 30S ribosomal protein S8 [Ignavibacteriae bacterium]|jgi:small subunit ribosomal protein S8|nr:30S ribosomal protein S8 [Ignavibacteriota bacterium]NOG97587.1 30S ribosomal protein S8 [Ignavibacteriota bacterium]